ncbi:MAG: hypothetical protein M5U23_08400 [Acidimicrobiia bacterium]|nr:hypothetical protein [Acidimicrobiia bacterium]
MLDERLRHAANEAHRVAAGFERPAIDEQRSRVRSRRLARTGVAAGAVVVLVGITWFAVEPMQKDDTPVTSEPPVVISDDPYVVQAPAALSPEFDLPPGAQEVPLLPIDQYLGSDASYIRSFISGATETTAIGQIDEDTHRVFLVKGSAAGNLTSDSPQPEGAPATCIVDTALKSGSCGIGDKGDTAPAFGLAEGWGTDDGSEYAVVKGTVPSSTSVVLVTTPKGSYWQIPRGGVAFLVIAGYDQSTEIGRTEIEWQFFDATGSIITVTSS